MGEGKYLAKDYLQSCFIRGIISAILFIIYFTISVYLKSLYSNIRETSRAGRTCVYENNKQFIKLK